MMIGSHHFWHISEATFGVIVVGVVSVIAAYQGKRGRRVERKIDDAAVKVTIATKNADTGNDKSLGETVHDIAQTQEVLSGQIHTNTREVLSLGDRFDRHLLDSRQVHREILERLPKKKGA